MKHTLLTRWMIISTILISTLTAVASLAGLFMNSPYGLETENWRLQAQGQDIGNLLGTVALLIGAALARKGSMRGYLVWLGTLFYFVYAYLVYAMAVHFNSLFLVYVAILGLSIYTLIAAFQRPLFALTVNYKASRTLAGITLIVIGSLFGLLWLGELIPALLSGKIPESLTEAGLWVNPIHVIDLSVVLPGFIITGYLLLKNERRGLFFAAPWLAFSVLMGSSIVAAMVLMVAHDYSDAIPPMVMVSTIVFFSLTALTHLLTHVSRHE